MDMEWAEVKAILDRRLAIERDRLLSIVGDRETGIVQGRAQVLTELLRLPDLIVGLRQAEAK